MSVKNPQNKDFIFSKRFAFAQDVFGALAFVLAVVQGMMPLFPVNVFLTISALILIAEYISSYCKSSFFDKGHRIREIGLIDNSFNEKKIPNYDSESYYNNASVLKEEVKLLANIHENSLFTFRIVEKMLCPYYFWSATAFLFFSIKLFMSGMDDYSSLWLGFIVSGSFFDRTIRLHSLKKVSEEVYEKANEICSMYEKNSIKTSMILSQIIELLLLYENAIFESKINLSEKIFRALNTSVSKEWITDNRCPSRKRK